jgi:hypothetical protein
MVVVYGGKGLDDLWGLGKLSENVFDPSVDGVDGVRIAVKPIAGLSLGYALPFKSTGEPLGDVFGSSVFGALYKSDLFSIALSAALKPGTDKVKAGEQGKNWEVKWNDPDWEVVDKPSAGADALDPWVRILAGVEVNPIAGLLVIVDGDIDTRKARDDKNKAINDRNGYIRIGPFVQYSTGPLAAHVQGDITIRNDGYGKNNGKALKGEKIKDYLGYLDNIVKFEGGKDAKTEDWVPVEKIGDPIVAVELGASYGITETINAYLNLGSDNVLYPLGTEDVPGSGIYAKPGVKIALGSSSIEIFDKINGIGAPALKKGSNNGKDDLSSLTNQFQIDLNWSF